MPEQSTVQAFIHNLREMERTGEVRPLVDMFSDQSQIESAARIGIERGPEGAEKFWRSYLSAFADVQSDFSSVIEQDGRAALEWTSNGHLRDGEAVQYKGTSIIECQNGRIVRFRTYYDASVFLGTLRH